MARHRRQFSQHAEFVEFLTPEVLKQYELPERYRNATFDRDLAVRRTDADFLALGHPFVDAMLSYVGSYDFGGLTSRRVVKAPELAGVSGMLFAFVARRRITREDGDECLFDFHPVFVRSNGEIDEAAALAAVHLTAQESENQDTPANVDELFATAKKHLEQRAALWDWDEDIEFIGLSWTRFVRK